MGVDLLIKFKNLQYPKIYEEIFNTLSDYNLMDENTEASLQFISTVNILILSTHLPNYVLTKLLRQLAMVAVQSGRSEVTQKILDVLKKQKFKNPTDKAWTMLLANQDFNYKASNKLKNGGISTVHPELMTLRSHLEPDIVMNVGVVLRGELKE